MAPLLLPQHLSPFQAPFYTWGGIAAGVNGAGLTSNLRLEQQTPSSHPPASCSRISQPTPDLAARLRHQNMMPLQYLLHPTHGKHQLPLVSHHPPRQVSQKGN